MTARTAHELVAAYSEERIWRQIEQTDWLKKKIPNKVTNLGAYLAQAIREDFAPPPGFESQADREKRRAAEETQRRREQEEARRRQAEEARERAEQARISTTGMPSVPPSSGGWRRTRWSRPTSRLPRATGSFWRRGTRWRGQC